MKAIVTKFYGPSEKRGARIVARAEGVRSLSVPYEYGGEYPHAIAARKLAERCGWTGRYVGGGLPDQSSRVFVCASEEREVFEVSRG